MNYRSMIVTVAAGFMLVGCGTAGSTGGTLAGPAQPMGVDATLEARTHASNKPQSSTLYVANQMANSVTAYNAKGQYLASATNQVELPDSIAVGPGGDVYVTNYGNRSIQEYSAGLKSLVTTITADVAKPKYVLVDSTNTVYGSMSRDVRVYPNAKTSGAYRIFPGGGPIALDNQNNLYVAENGAVAVYASGKKHKARKIATTSQAIITTLAVDGNSNLYVGETNVENNGPCSSGVFVYDASTGSLVRTLSQNICDPTSIAFDAQQNAYIANDESVGSYIPNVTEFAAGATTVLAQITEGVSDPVSVAVAQNGTLYVANRGQNNIAVYSAGSVSPTKTITSKIKTPNAIVLGLR